MTQRTQPSRHAVLAEVAAAAPTEPFVPPFRVWMLQPVAVSVLQVAGLMLNEASVFHDLRLCTPCALCKHAWPPDAGQSW